jgi:hypothetical protein
MPRFATLTFVGPGEVEARRLMQLLESLQFFEPGVNTVVIIDDRSGLDFSALVPSTLLPRIAIVKNSRNGEGDWWQGGLCVGLVDGFKYLAAQEPFDFVVRLDTDALVIGKFAERIHAKFQSIADAGLLGTWDKYPVSGKQRLPHKEMNDAFIPILKKLTRHFAVWRHDKKPTRIQCSLNPSDLLVRSIVLAAISNGYRLGDFLQGGAYAINGVLVRRLSENGYLRSPRSFLRQQYGEDALVTLLCYAAGYRAEGFNSKGDVFGVQFKGLPAAADDLVNFGYSIVHSIKADCQTEEMASYENFVTLRKLTLLIEPRE